MPRKACGLVWITLALAGPAAAAEPPAVSWRHDYAAARQEAAATNRPLVLYFTTTNCPWCHKMQAGPLRDPAVAAALNADFVPLKVEGDLLNYLAGPLHIQGFPTTVLASPEGRVLEVLDGYQDAATVRDHLRRATAAVVAGHTRPADGVRPASWPEPKR
jgi:hypothetical protein